jgi:hypothetical protein
VGAAGAQTVLFTARGFRQLGSGTTGLETVLQLLHIRSGWLARRLHKRPTRTARPVALKQSITTAWSDTALVPRVQRLQHCHALQQHMRRLPSRYQLEVPAAPAYPVPFLSISCAYPRVRFLRCASLSGSPPKPIRATSPAHLILQDLIILITYEEEYKS